MPGISDQYNVINNIILTEQTSVPTTPPSGKQRLYVSASGINIVNSGGDIINFNPASGWNLASETWTYYSADAPTYVFGAVGASTKYSPGMKVKYAQSTGSAVSDKYAIITDVTGSLVTAYHGTDYIMSRCAIINPQYSMVKSPLGFPSDRTKWRVQFIDTNLRSQATPTDLVWYNVGSTTIVLPIGSWIVDYRVVLQGLKNSDGLPVYLSVTLSTADNSESDIEFTCNVGGSLSYVSGNTGYIRSQVTLMKTLNLINKTTYYLNMKSIASSLSTIYYINSDAPCIINAYSAYL